MTVERLERLDTATRGVMVDLWERAWTPTMPTIDFFARRSWFGGYLESLLAGGAILLVIRDAAAVPIGFLTLQPDSGEIDQLAVDPPHGGSGTGRALMDEAKRRSTGRLNLTVNKANLRALRFYQRAGFVVTGEGLSPRSNLPIWHMAWVGTADEQAGTPSLR